MKIFRKSQKMESSWSKIHILGTAGLRMSVYSSKWSQDWFNIVVFRYMYLSDNRKCPKMPKRAWISKLGQNGDRHYQIEITRALLRLHWCCAWIKCFNAFLFWEKVIELIQQKITTIFIFMIKVYPCIYESVKIQSI